MGGGGGGWGGSDFVLFLQNIGLLRDMLPSIDILTFPGTVVIVLRNTILH